MNTFLLAGHKLRLEMHLIQLRFIYSAFGQLTKNRGRIQKIKETGYSRNIYQNKLNKACFQHEAVYRDFKHLAISSSSDKLLRDKAFNIAKNPKNDGY